MIKKTILLLFSFSLFMGNKVAFGQRMAKEELTIEKPANPKVTANWGRPFDHARVNAFCLQLAQAFPALVRMETIGDSYGGRRMLALVISDYNTGDPDRKPGYYLDGNILSNDQQAVEQVLFTAWYLAESFEKNSFTKELLQQKTFYLVPTINPDGLDALQYGLNSEQAPMSGMMPVDDDGDGLVDEDHPEDLDGDGNITFMRRKSVYGRYLINPENPNWIIQAQQNQLGVYELLGQEGMDNDSDGKINEDANGCYDPDLDWAWDWQPDYVQPGAFKYPFSITETRSVKEFIMRHPNIATAQNFHYRAPVGQAKVATITVPLITSNDQLVYQSLEQKAISFMSEFPNSLTLKDQLVNFGGELAWFQGGRGVFTFYGVLSSPFLEFHRRALPGASFTPGFISQEQIHLFKDAFVEWKPFDHPNYGLIEIGGYKKNFGNDTLSIFSEEEAFQNLAITLYQAYQTPQLVIQDVQTRKLKNGFTEVTATVVNTRLLPTHSAHDLKNKIERPDYVILRDSTVVSGQVVEPMGLTSGTEQNYLPHKVEVPNIAGESMIKVRWLVKAANPRLEIEVDSRKGGSVVRRF